MKTRLLIWVVAALCMGLLSARSKTVTWEEEVPLNTGEVIWVKRTVTYKLQGASGNPLDIAYRPDWTETRGFIWQGRDYSYTGSAGLMLLAISPITNRPVLVARADLKNWDRENNFRCTTPYYVQLTPDGTEKDWIWPLTIESWLHGMPYNLMHYRPELSEGKPRYGIQDRLEYDRITKYQSPSLSRIDPSFSFNQCRK